MIKKSAFTLVEMIVWITISMLLMTSIWILVSWWISNILKQNNIISKNTALTQTVSDFYSWFDSIQSASGYVYHSNSWAIFKVKQNIQNWGFWYIWILSQTWWYCSDESEVWELDYLVWKSFIPHEEIWEDINKSWGFEDIYNQTYTSWTIQYIVDTLNHEVTQDGMRIIWWDISWHEIQQWENWLNTRLNNPTWIAWWEWWLFISDTLNNRVLFYSEWNVYLLLDQYDGLSEPTGLAYDDINNILYIANSWKWEILKLSSEVLSDNPNLNISFTPEININNINRLSFIFPEVIDPLSVSDFNFNWITSNTDFVDTNWNTVDYYFSNFSNNINSQNNISIPWCTPNIIYSLNADWYTPEKEEITCITWSTWSINRFNGNIYQNFSSSTDYEIEIQNITPIFTEWNHIVEMKLYNGNTEEYSESFSYFQQWDWFVNNMEYVSLETIISWLWYPTWLRLSWSDILINDFISRNQYTYDVINYNRNNTDSLEPFTGEKLQNIPFHSERDILLKNPLSSLEINYDSTDNFLSAYIKYYQYLNCYNPDEFSIKSFILQKNID